jgi:hypothetical protein
VVQRLAGLLCLVLATLIFAAPGAANAIRTEAPAAPAVSVLFPWASFDGEVPTQEELLGVAPAERPLRPDELLRYFEALAQSPRARLIPYARSHEGRPLVLLAISDEASIARLDELRLEHLERTDPRGRTPEQSRAALEEAKAVAWMGYSIHGNELSGSDAGAALAYWLVAGQDERARKLRSELIILVDPCENPDGRARALAHTTAFAHAVPNPDPEDLHHSGVWPWGRGNHYLFDLNRDWFSRVHPESRRSELIAKWNPQILVDAHEMGSDSTYLFTPGRAPFNPLQPPAVRRWRHRLAADQATRLDEGGWTYYRGEWNENFFPGYGSSWASYHGTVAMLYEMSATSGTVVRQSSGTLRTYAEAVDHQVRSSVANLETAAENRLELLSDYVATRRAALEQGAAGPVAAWLLPPGHYPDRTDALAELLRSQGIEVLRTGSAVKATGLRHAHSGDESSLELPAGTWMVPMDQPAGALARVLLDPHVPMDPAFLREQREWLERGRGSRLYDTTAWSLPMAYGIEAYWTSQKPAGAWDSSSPDPRTGSLEPADSPNHWAFEGTSDRSAAALAELLQGGISVRVAEKPFRIAGRAFASGTVLVRREGNPADLSARLAALAERHALQVHALSTSRADEGPDLGGRHYPQLVLPRVGVFAGMPVSPPAYGFVWHLLDIGLGLRFSALDLGRWARLDLDRYNVLVFPPVWGGADGYRRIVGDAGIERLRLWIEAGGTAIGIGAGAEFLADTKTGLTQTRLRRQALDRYPPVVYGLEPDRAEKAGPFRAVGVRAPEAAKKPAEATPSAPPAGADSTPAPSAEAAANPAPPAETPVERASAYHVAPVLGPAARFFAEQVYEQDPAAAAPRDLAAWLKPFLPPGKNAPEQADLERADARLRLFAPTGTFLRIELDADVWLSWGLPAELPAYTNASDALVAEPPVQVAARYADLERVHLAGLLWPEAAGRLAHTAYATRESRGRGQVILFASEPAFRGWTLGTQRLLVNAILYGPGLGTSWSAPW